MSIYQKLRLDQQLGDLETEFAYHSLKHLMQLEERIQKHHQQLEPRTLARLIIQSFEQLKIPFSGEPTKGLQLMGFLETRALDFERVILVSTNEGKLPRGNRHTSYIPYAVRKAFKLPTFEEQDAIYAYHFKRVLQRAKDIIVLYNTEVAIDGSGEKSRFIWQLIESFPKDSISQHVYQMSLSKLPASATLEIQKSSKVVEMMQRFLVDNGEEKSLSPTAVRHYLDCSLRFYFRYLVSIREREKESSELDPRDFGNIVHHGLERLYQPLTGETVSRDRIKELLDSQVITEAVDWAIKNHFKKSSFSVIEGKDLLHEQIIQKLIYKVVEKDLREAPFTLTGTEIKITSDLEFNPGKAVRLEGTLDRVHVANGIVHIVDYKTGKADLISNKAFRNDIVQYVQAHFDEPRYKSGFQGFFYGYLWGKNNGKNPVKLGVYPLKKVNDGTRWLNHESVVPPSGFKEFERLLITTLKELFDETVPFTQTDDTDRCRYCTYKEICQR
jgi:CRISPR/Cas system-associated exonuclease Cas4 (RecB family)